LVWFGLVYASVILNPIQFELTDKIYESVATLNKNQSKDKAQAQRLLSFTFVSG